MKDAPKRTPRKQGTTRAEREKLPVCGAQHTKRAGTCKKPAGWGTSHPGEGRCKLHGGTTQKVSTRYQMTNASPSLRAAIDAQRADPDPLNLMPDLLLARALLSDGIERHSEVTEALIAWHASHTTGYLEAVDLWRQRLAKYVEDAESRGMEPEEGPPPPPIPESFERKPRQLPDQSAFIGLIDRVTGIVERIEKRQREGLISLTLLDSTLERMGMEVVYAAKEVGIDDTARTALLAVIERRWNAVRIDPATGTVQGAEAGGRGTLH